MGNRRLVFPIHTRGDILWREYPFCLFIIYACICTWRGWNFKGTVPNKSFVICIGETKLKTHSFTSRVILFIRILSIKMFESCFREQAHFSFVEFPLTLHSAEKLNSVAITHGMSWDAGQCAFFSRSPVHPSDCRYSRCLGVSHTWSGVYRSSLYSSGWKPSSVGICILRISPC